MGNQSTFLFPEPFWLVNQIPMPESMEPMEYDAFFAEIAQWQLSSGVQISALRGGAFTFDFGQTPGASVDESVTEQQYFDSALSVIQKRVQIINAFSFCLHVTRMERENLGSTGFRIGPFDLIHGSKHSMGGATESWPPMVGGRIVQRTHRFGVVPRESLQASCELLDALLAHEFKKSVELAALLNDAIVAYKTYDYSSALVTAWTVCEALIQDRWATYFNGRGNQGVPISTKRREKLLGRDFTASVVIEMLELAGLIPTEEFAALEKSRKARNKWIHSINAPDKATAGETVQMSAKLLGDRLGREMTVGLGVVLHGLGD